MTKIVILEIFAFSIKFFRNEAKELLSLNFFFVENIAAGENFTIVPNFQNQFQRLGNGKND